MKTKKTENVSNTALTTELLSPREAAAYVKLSVGTIYNYVSWGKIPFHKTATGGVRFKREELDGWLLGN